LLDQHSDMLRHSFGLACQADTQPIAYFLANSCTGNAVDLNIIANSWIDHEIFLVGLAAVKTPGFQRDNGSRRSIVPLLFFFLLLLLQGRFAPTKAALLISPRRKQVRSGQCAWRKHKKTADFSAAFCR
jgi:hypothetical protein